MKTIGILLLYIFAILFVHREQGYAQTSVAECVLCYTDTLNKAALVFSMEVAKDGTVWMSGGLDNQSGVFSNKNGVITNYSREQLQLAAGKVISKITIHPITNCVYLVADNSITTICNGIVEKYDYKDIDSLTDKRRYIDVAIDSMGTVWLLNSLEFKTNVGSTFLNEIVRTGESPRVWRNQTPMYNLPGDSLFGGVFLASAIECGKKDVYVLGWSGQDIYTKRPPNQLTPFGGFLRFVNGENLEIYDVNNGDSKLSFRPSVIYPLENSALLGFEFDYNEGTKRAPFVRFDGGVLNYTKAEDMIGYNQDTDYNFDTRDYSFDPATNRTFIASSSGAFEYRNNTLTRYPAPYGAPAFSRAISIRYTPVGLYVAYNNLGVYLFRNQNTSISEQSVHPTVYPNPANQYIMLPHTSRVRMHDAQGLLVAEYQSVSEVPVQHLAAGLYCVSYIDNGKWRTENVVIQH